MVANNNSQMQRGRILRIAAGITMLALLLVGGAGASTLTVNSSGGANYTRIQDAIDNASVGDTILVYNGTYYENVNVTKQLTLRGIGMPVVNAGGNGSVIMLAADGILLEGFTAKGAGPTEYGASASPNAGIRVASNNNTLIGNNASNNYYGEETSFAIGIYMESSNNNTLIGNNANGNQESLGGYGISLKYSNNNTFLGNNANGNSGYQSYGIRLESSNNNILSGNNANANSGGIGSGWGGATGISLESSNNNTLIGNNADFNIGNSGYGIMLISANNNTLLGNNADDNIGLKHSINSGMTLRSSSNNTLSGNNASIILISSDCNLIYNNILNTFETFDLYESIDKWNITKISGTNIIGGSVLAGNFWANPQGTGFSQTCSDVNPDGICDEPYVLDGNNIDYLPLSYKPPFVSFINPTPANGANLTQNYAYINTSISDSSTAFIDWNLSLAGWWRFNNESNENQLFFRDWSTWGNNGTCSGVNCPSFTSGKFGNALNFDGINDYVDAGNGASLDITDAITIEAWINPAVAAPTFKGSYPGYSRGVAVEGNYAYVVNGENGLLIIDVSNPEAPTLKGSYNTGGNGVAVAGSYAYVVNGENGLLIIDVSNPEAPTLKGSYDTAGYARKVAVAGNYAYVADGSNGLVIIDVSNPAEPTLKGSYNTSGASDVAVAGNYAYVVGGSNGLAIIDVSNPAEPTLKGSYPWSSENVAVEGNYVYLTYSYRIFGLAIIDVSNPAEPTLKGSYNSHTQINELSALAVAGNYAYVAGGYSQGGFGLLIVDVSDPAAPTLKGGYWELLYTGPYGVTVEGNYAYMAVSNIGLVIVDVSDPVQEKCWDGVSGNYGVMSKVSAPANSVNWSWALRYGAPGGGCYLGFAFNGNPEGPRWVTVKQNLTAGHWYHIVGTFNGTDINLYLNGKLTDTNKISAIKGYRNRLLIGNDGWANLFNGKIDEVRIHKRALSPEEIKASYNAGINRLYKNFTGLTGGTYNYQAYAQNLAGAVNKTETRTLTFASNLIAMPSISFINPTPGNGAILSQNYAFINTTVSNVSTAFIDWNLSLAGWWRFNGESGENSILFRDWSSWGNNAACSGISCPTSTTGKFGNALNFDGSNDYIIVPNSAILNPSNITLEAWFNANSGGLAGQKPLIQKPYTSHAAPYYQYMLSLADTAGSPKAAEFYLAVNGVMREVEIKNLGYNYGQWHYLAGTYNGSTMTMYLDGNIVGTTQIVGKITPYNTILEFGAYPNLAPGSSNVFNGKLDEARIHSRALSPEEIKASYNAGIYRLYNNFTKLPTGVYNYVSYGQDLSGNMNKTETRTLTIISNQGLPEIRFINGTVKDNSTGNSLAGVNVSANSTLSTISNATGFYSFAVIDGTYNLTATFDIRYYTKITTVSTIGKAVAVQDIELVRKPTGTITGNVKKCCTLG